MIGSRCCPFGRSPLSCPKDGERGKIVNLRVLACAAFALGIVASPAAAQPAPLDQLAQAQPQEPAPPPFPPMPRAKPSHRWVDVGGHHTTSHHRTTQARHRTTSSKHHATRSEHRSTRSRHAKAHAAHHLTRAERDLRYCHQLTPRHQMRNSRCKALLRDERRAAERARHLKAAKAAKALRVCHRLSHRKLRHNSRCQTLLRAETRAAAHRKAARRHHHHRR